MDIQVRHLLRRKGTTVVTIRPEATVYDAIETMVDFGVGSIVVVEDGALAGIFTERDYLRRIALEGRTSRTTRVEEVMTSDVLTVSTDTTLDTCLTLMSEARCRHLPVVVEGRLSGLISMGDCVKALLRDAEATVDALHNYVTGSYSV
jgi:CBS domain-containing protein